MNESATNGGRLPGGFRVLVVEDNAIIALDAEDKVRDLGATLVAVAASVAEARRLLADQRFDAAILDIDLGRETSLPLAEHLLDLGVPFAFATGYADPELTREEFRSAVALQKPFDEDLLLAALLRLAAPRDCE